jgi:outer membrane biosynthesis protein TonB
VNPKLDDVPPPPPPVPDAAPPVASTKQQVGGTGTSVGACDAKCTGTASADLNSALQQRAAAARRCYNSALANDSSLKGRVVLDVKISTNGSVCAVGVSQTDMPTVAPCVANVFRGASFTPPSGGCVERAVPMNFTSAGGM